VPKSSAVVVPPGNGPAQPVLVFEEINEPSVPLYISIVPQKANDVLSDPVVFFIDKVSVLVIGVAVSQELHRSPPLNFAASTERSLEVQEVLAGGKV
jgi:hypothetical protein